MAFGNGSNKHINAINLNTFEHNKGSKISVVLGTVPISDGIPQHLKKKKKIVWSEFHGVMNMCLYFAFGGFKLHSRRLPPSQLAPLQPFHPSTTPSTPPPPSHFLGRGKKPRALTGSMCSEREIALCLLCSLSQKVAQA